MQKQETKSAAISLALIFLVLLIAVGLIVELLRLYVPSIRARSYFLALLIALPIPTWVLCAAGNLILSGDWFFSVALVAVLYGIVGLLFVKRDSLPGKIKARLHKLPR